MVFCVAHVVSLENRQFLLPTLGDTYLCCCKKWVLIFMNRFQNLLLSVVEFSANITSMLTTIMLNMHKHFKNCEVVVGKIQCVRKIMVTFLAMCFQKFCECQTFLYHISIALITGSTLPSIRVNEPRRLSMTSSDHSPVIPSPRVTTLPTVHPTSLASSLRAAPF